MKRLLAIISLLVLLAPMIVLASDISGATYYSVITVTNSGTDADDVFTTFPLNTQNLIDNNFLNASANDSAMQNTAGADIVFMPATNATYPWCFYVDSINEDASLNYLLYTGGGTDMSSEIRYFPDIGGMTSVDSATLELSDNFTIEQKGWVDTANATAKNLVYKPTAFRTYISPTVAGNITSGIPFFGDDFSTDTWTDFGAGVGVNVGTEKLEYNVVGGDHRSSKDIGAGNISDSRWRLDFTWHPTVSTAPLAFFHFGISDALANAGTYPTDAIWMGTGHQPACWISRYDGGVLENSTIF